MKDPRDLSVLNSQEAVRKVHAASDVSAETPLEAHPDPAVPGATFVDGPADDQYWVGMQGEVIHTRAGKGPAASAELRGAQERYTSAVERVRRHYGTPPEDELFAVPDTFVPQAFFVYDTQAAQTVRWVAPDGAVHSGYHVVGDAPQWDEETVRARTQVLRGQLGTQRLVGTDTGTDV